MKFMDKKEQVLDIQLTPYGEYLLSQGKFKPEYYSFYDDNILYESQYAGYTDSQNNIEPRTQEDTPQPETQVVFSDRNIFIRRGIGAEADGNLVGYLVPGVGLAPGGGIVPKTTVVYQVEGEGEIEQQPGEGIEGVTIDASYFERRMYDPQSCLGTSDILTTDSPAWSVSMLRGEITGSAVAITGSNTPVVNIPQLDVTLTYKINTVSDRQFISDTELAIQYPNGQYLDVKPEIILAQVIEKNSEYTRENFDIQVFEVLSNTLPGMSSTVDELRPLKFRKPYSLVKDGVLLDRDEVMVPYDPLTTEHVEYYFDIKTDSKIDNQLICSSLEELKVKGFYVDADVVCKDTENISLVDIYSTDAASEPCPDLDDPCEPGTVY
jgi:hypothetical protein